ncbi:MAG: ABC transporter permease [Elusimicrobiota bacterium]|jgi:lipoprotein-releasing system permease protein
MSFEFFLATRFLAGQRFGVFRLITTAIAIGGTALGVAALLITLAVMDGFRTDIQEKILGTQPHIVAMNPFGAFVSYDKDQLDHFAGVPGVTGASPFISAQALLQSSRKVTGILLRGISFEGEARVTRLNSILAHGQWQGLEDRGIVLGEELAMAIGASIGDRVTLISPQEQKASWTQMPRMRPLTVVGVFHSGMYEYDANMAYVSLATAQDLLGISRQISGYGLRLKDVDQAPAVQRALQSQLSQELWTRSWQDFNKPLFSAMKLERTMMFIILTLIILVSSFTIISNLLLLTIEKAREIGILQALGASPRQIAGVFFLNGLFLGGSGVGLGLVLGVGISAVLRRYPIIRLPSEVYYIDRLPIHLSLPMVGSVAACALTLVLASIFYPAWKASQMDPVQAIRYG